MDNQWPPKNAGGNISDELADKEERAFAKKHPDREKHYMLDLDKLETYLKEVVEQGAEYLAIVNTLMGNNVGNGYCCINGEGRIMDMRPETKQGYERFMKATAGDQTALYGYSINYLMAEFEKARAKDAATIVFSNAINEEGNNTLVFGFMIKGGVVIFGVSSRGNNPFLCPPVCPPQD